MQRLKRVREHGCSEVGVDNDGICKSCSRLLHHVKGDTIERLENGTARCKLHVREVAVEEYL